MTLTQYSDTVLVCEARGFSPEDRIVHGAMGLMTEVVEYVTATTEANAMEEIGDSMWYIALLFNAHHVPIREPQMLMLGSTTNELISCAGAVLDCAKKHKFYKRPFDGHTAVENMLDRLYTRAVRSHGWSWDQVLGTNIQKLLSIRYPQGFTPAAATLRNLVAEQQVFEEVIKNGKV